MKPVFRLWGRNRARREVDEEIRAHLEMRARELEERGLSAEEARREAERRFGEVGRARRRLIRGARRRDAGLRLGDHLRDVGRDLTLALRQTRRRRGSAALELAVFALGVGLTTATFTLVDQVLLRPLPLPESDRLVSLESVDSTGNAFPRVSASNWYDWRDGARTLASSGLYEFATLPVATDQGAVNVSGRLVAGEFFRTVRMPMAWGRTPTAREAEAGGAGVVVARGLWERLVGGPPRAGGVLRVSGTPREVTGVVSSGAEYPPGTELWLPVHPTRGSGGMRNNINWYAVGRLAEGASMEEARRDLSGIALGIRDTDPEAIYSFGVGVTPLRDFVVGGTSTWLWLLMGGATVVLLVACVNLAALNVGRAAAEWRASAVRRALGAGRARLVRQHATRHILLACVGGGLGVLGAHMGIGALLAAADLPLPRVAGVALDTRIAVFGIAVSLVAGLLAGLVPALRASTASLRAGGGRSRGGHSTRRTGSVLVGLELALAVVLVTAAALVVRDLRSLLDRGLGFDPAGIVTARTSLVEDEYRDPERRSTYWLRVRDAVRELPGVESAAVSSTVPAGNRGTGFIEVEGWTGPTTGASYQTAGEGYFRTLSIRLLEGRSFGPRDAGGTERVVVVNRALAERYWPGESALGRRIRALSMEGIGPDPAPWLTVIGVVEDIRHHGFRSDPRPEMYVDFRQAPAYWMGNLSVVAKTREGGEATTTRSAVREAVRRIDPRLAVEAGLLTEELAGLLAEERLVTRVLTAFGLLATLLAALGVYGMVSLMVSLRTREMGIRAALGARASELLRLVVGAAARVALLALPFGLASAWLVGPALRPLLEEVTPTDPVAYAVAAGCLLAVTVLAALVPAFRAARADPVRTLREERV